MLLIFLLSLSPSLSCALLGTDPLWQVARLGYFKVNLSTGGIKKVASTCSAGAVISAHLKQPLSDNISKRLKKSKKKDGENSKKNDLINTEQTFVFRF